MGIFKGGAMSEVVLTDVTKKFGDFTAVDDITMRIEDVKFTVLVGASEEGVHFGEA